MKKSSFFNRKLMMVSVLMMLLVMVTGVVYATIITVDGNPTDWPGNPSCVVAAAGCSLLVANDPEESALAPVPPNPAMPPSADIRTLWGTNSNTTLYARYDTQAATSYAAGEFVRLCLDTPSGGPGQANIGGCIGHNTDYVVEVQAGLLARVFDCNVVDCNNRFSATTSATAVVSGSVTEVAVTFASIGVTPADDGGSIGLVGYFDNNGLPPDDNVPDSGFVSWPIGTGSPTAVNLQSFSTNSADTVPTVGIIAFALLAIIGTGVALTRRQQA